MSGRILGILEGEKPGPLVFFIAALHGNEIHGVEAFQNIHNSLISNNIAIKGKIVGLTGNTEAKRKKQRYIDYDMNRCWKDDYIQFLRNSQKLHHSEDTELLELHGLLEQHSEGTFTEKIIVDLHGTSSDNGNFIVVPENQEKHNVIKALHLPIVIDLERYLDGTLLGFYSKKGYTSFAFEGGLIGSQEAVDLHISGIWEILDASGTITHHDHQEMDHYQNKLKKVSAHLPKVVKAFHRHWVDEGDEFKMNPGYKNFQVLKEGEELAKDKYGPIYAPKKGMIFLPLYQKSGNDGFFIVEEVRI